MATDSDPMYPAGPPSEPPVQRPISTWTPPPEPWETPTAPHWAAPVTRAGAVIHLDAGGGAVRCGSRAMPIVRVHDIGMVTCPQCRLLVSFPHVSPCDSELVALHAAAEAAQAPVVVDRPRRRDRTWVPLAAGVGTIATAAVVAAVLFVGHGSTSSSGTAGSAYTAPSDVAPAGGGVADLDTPVPTAFSTPLPTAAPAPEPTAAPTSPPAPTVVVNNQAQAGSTAGTSYLPVVDPAANPAPAPYGSCFLWARGTASFVVVSGPGVTSGACAHLLPYLVHAEYVLSTETRGGEICAVPSSLIPVGATGQVDDGGTFSTSTGQRACADLEQAASGT